MAGTILLDGPMGTELNARGVETPLPGWSAHALEDAPGLVRDIHRAYAAAGASIHTTNTFRTRPAVFPDWERLARTAVRLAREGLGPGHRLAGSIAPLQDCYRPDLSPAGSDHAGTLTAHGELASLLAAEGCDLLLCETFPHVGEGLLATQAAVATGLETWTSFTAGPDADLLTPREVAAGAIEAVRIGASAVLVNCVPARCTLEYVEALAEAVGDQVTIGAYSNAGQVDEKMGWASAPGAPEAYAECAATWVAAGAQLIGGCCGTGPDHVAALAAL